MTAKIKLNAASGGGSVSLQAPTSTTGNANVEFKLPVADGTSGQALTTNASGQLAFATVSSAIQTTSGTDNFTIADGNLIIGTSGHGIDFSATSDASGKTSELLDNYEEGTWTPGYTVAGGVSGMTFSTQEGYYTRIGRFVFASYHIQLSAKGTSSGAGWVTLNGLPFTATNIGGGGTANYWDSFDSGFCPTVFRVIQSGSEVYIARINTAQETSTDLNIGQLTNSSNLYGTLFYPTAS